MTDSDATVIASNNLKSIQLQYGEIANVSNKSSRFFAILIFSTNSGVSFAPLGVFVCSMHALLSIVNSAFFKYFVMLDVRWIKADAMVSKVLKSGRGCLSSVIFSLDFSTRACSIVWSKYHIHDSVHIHRYFIHAWWVFIFSIYVIRSNETTPILLCFSVFIIIFLLVNCSVDAFVTGFVKRFLYTKFDLFIWNLEVHNFWIIEHICLQIGSQFSYKLYNYVQYVIGMWPILEKPPHFPGLHLN